MYNRCVTDACCICIIANCPTVSDKNTHLTASFPGQLRWAGTIKVKSIWILMKQEVMGWQWHQLDHMQIICILLQTDNYASTSSLKFLQAECSSWHSANSVKALKATVSDSLKCSVSFRLPQLNWTVYSVIFALYWKWKLEYEHAFYCLIEIWNV